MPRVYVTQAKKRKSKEINRCLGALHFLVQIISLCLVLFVGGRRCFLFKLPRTTLSSGPELGNFISFHLRNLRGGSYGKNYENMLNRSYCLGSMLRNMLITHKTRDKSIQMSRNGDFVFA